MAAKIRQQNKDKIIQREPEKTRGLPVNKIQKNG